MFLILEITVLLSLSRHRPYITAQLIYIPILTGLKNITFVYIFWNEDMESVQGMNIKQKIEIK